MGEKRRGKKGYRRIGEEGKGNETRGKRMGEKGR